MPRVQLTKGKRIALSILMIYVIALIVLIVIRFVQTL